MTFTRAASKWHYCCDLNPHRVSLISSQTSLMFLVIRHPLRKLKSDACKPCAAIVIEYPLVNGELFVTLTDFQKRF